MKQLKTTPIKSLNIFDTLGANAANGTKPE